MDEMVRFRGKPIDQLTREEMLEALKQALAEVARLHGVPLDFSRGTTMSPIGPIPIRRL